MSRFLCYVAAVLLAAGSTVCVAADSPNPWNGTWKLNEAKSKLTGEVETVSIASDGLMTVATSGISFSFRCDGKPYTILPGRSLVCTEAGSQEMHVVMSANGNELGHVIRTISNGGKTQTVVEDGRAADGTPFHDTQVYSKLAGGAGWDGKWQQTREEASVRGVAIVQATADSISFSYPMSKSSLTAKLDGTPASEEGPRTVAGMTISLTADGPRTIHEIDSLNGKVMEHDTLSMSEDGSFMTIEVMRTGGTEKQVYVYDRQ